MKTLKDLITSIEKVEYKVVIDDVEIECTLAHLMDQDWMLREVYMKSGISHTPMDQEAWVSYVNRFLKKAV